MQRLLKSNQNPKKCSVECHRYVGTRGPSIKYVSTFEGGGVSGMLTLADIGEGGLSRMLTSAIFTLNSMKIWIQNM